MHPHQAEAAALVETQRIDVVISGNDPQAGASLPCGQMPDRLDQGGPRPVPLLAGVEGEDLALLPVLPRHVREHAEQPPPGGLGDKRRMIQRAGQLSQAGHPETVVAGKELLGRSLVGGLPRTDLHRPNVTAMEQGTIARRPGGTLRVGCGGSSYTPRGHRLARVYLQGEWRILVVTKMADDETGAPGV